MKYTQGTFNAVYEPSLDPVELESGAHVFAGAGVITLVGPVGQGRKHLWIAANGQSYLTYSIRGTATTDSPGYVPAAQVLKIGPIQDFAQISVYA